MHGIGALRRPQNLSFQCFDTTERLHQRLRQTELLGDESALLEAICSCADSDTGWTIYEALLNYLRSDTSQITGFRASIVYSFTTDDINCVLVEWREQSGKEALAVFDVDRTQPEYCSYMVHSGTRLDIAGEKRWNRTSISWNLPEMSILCVLLEAVQHVSGLLDMPRSDVKFLYCKRHEENCSVDEYITPWSALTLFRLRKYTQLLFRHFVRIEQVKSAVGTAMPLLDERTLFKSRFKISRMLIIKAFSVHGQEDIRYVGSVDL